MRRYMQRLMGKKTLVPSHIVSIRWFKLIEFKHFFVWNESSRSFVYLIILVDHCFNLVLIQYNLQLSNDIDFW